MKKTAIKGILLSSILAFATACNEKKEEAPAPGRLSEEVQEA